MRPSVLAAVVAAVAWGTPAAAAAIEQPAQPAVAALVDAALLAELRGYAAAEIVAMTVRNQNDRYRTLDPAEVDALDKEWRAEVEAAEKPRIATTLSRPLSNYLTRVQAHSNGLIVEIIVMDANGLNVGQSAVSSDYWQGDEDKWALTFPKGPEGLFVDAAEFDDELGIWRVQVNMAVASEGRAIGAATFAVNLTELARRRAAK